MVVNKDIIDCCFGRAPVFQVTVEEVLILAHWALPAGLQTRAPISSKEMKTKFVKKLLNTSHKRTTQQKCSYISNGGVYTIICVKKGSWWVGGNNSVVVLFTGSEVDQTMPKKWWATSSSPPSTGRMSLKRRWGTGGRKVMIWHLKTRCSECKMTSFVSSLAYSTLQAPGNIRDGHTLLWWRVHSTNHYNNSSRQV